MARPARSAAAVAVVLLLASAACAGSGQASSETEATPGAVAPDCGAPVAKAGGGEWECVFADDFDGEALDGEHWTVLSSAQSGYRNGPECYLGADSPLGADDVVVADGVLRLTARELDREITCPSASGDFTSRWTGAFVTTYGKLTATYGRLAVRAAFPDVDVPGVHSGIWLWPQELAYGSEVTGELDVAEYFSRYPDRAVPFLHYRPAVPDGTNTGNDCLLEDPSAMHEYVVEWEPGHVLVTFDGVPCVDHTVDPAAPLTAPAPFDQPYTVNLTQALGLGDNAFTEATPLPATLTVDSVRLWR